MIVSGRKSERLAAFIDGASLEDIYLHPLITKSIDASSDFLPIGSGRSRGFAHVELIRRNSDGSRDTLVLSASELMDWLEGPPSPIQDHLAWLLTHISAKRDPWAGLRLDRPLVMGIVNATPDSFSDGGQFFHHNQAIEQGHALLSAGADIIDVGGESTRPGASPVGCDEEAYRVVPIIIALADAGALVSIDTRHAFVMRAALDAGARIINDVTALADPEAAAFAIERRAPVVLMHMQGEPATMQDAPHYRDAALDVFDFLSHRVKKLEGFGLSRNQVMLDPGIGFGKTPDHNVALLTRLGLFLGIGCGLLIGASRKGFIAAIARDRSSANQRLGGSLAIAIDAIGRGANVIRVHDVAETVQALRILEALKGI